MYVLNMKYIRIKFFTQTVKKKKKNNKQINLSLYNVGKNCNGSNIFQFI